MHELFSHSATVLAVSNMEQSIQFYQEQLGFQLTFAWKEPIEYAVLKRGSISIHLSLTSKDQQFIPNNTLLYIFVHDIDAVYEELINKRVLIKSQLGERDYAMKDFDIEDPDGYVLTFGQETS